MNRRSLGSRRLGPIAAAAIGVVALVAFAAPAASALAAAQPGKYRGDVFDPGEQPDDEQWVRFKVKGSKVKSFTSRLWVICYAGGTSYINLPVKFSAPPAKINGRGRVDHSWTDPFTVDGEAYELNGVLKLKFKGSGKVSGEISVEFGSCGTTTGDPPGSMLIRAKRK